MSLRSVGLQWADPNASYAQLMAANSPDQAASAAVLVINFRHEIFIHTMVVQIDVIVDGHAKHAHKRDEGFGVVQPSPSSQ